MAQQIQTLKQMFQRYRRPGNLFFASIFLLFSLALCTQLGIQAKWLSGTKWSSQPALWPNIAIIGMTIFAALNWISAFVSEKIDGRWAEIMVWIRSFEFVLWFMVYVILVPLLGYLPSTVLFGLALSFRMGYRSLKMLSISAFASIAIVVTFKSFLQVRVPGGKAYEFLPDALRSFMLTYL